MSEIPSYVKYQATHSGHDGDGDGFGALVLIFIKVIAIIIAVAILIAAVYYVLKFIVWLAVYTYEFLRANDSFFKSAGLLLLSPIWLPVVFVVNRCPKYSDMPEVVIVFMWITPTAIIWGYGCFLLMEKVILLD